VVGAHETPAGPADDGNAKLAQRLDDVCSETALVGERRSRLEDAAVDLPVKMLQKLAEDHPVEPHRVPVRVDVYAPVHGISP
jgi:hypothetical protein